MSTSLVESEIKQVINDSLQKPTFSSAFEIFFLTKKYFEQSQFNLFPQDTNAVEPVELDKINQQLQSYCDFKKQLGQVPPVFEPVTATTTMGELERIVSQINQQPLITLDPHSDDLNELNRQVQAYANYKGIKIRNFNSLEKVKEEIGKINQQKPINLLSISKLNQQIEKFCLFKDKTEQDKTVLTISKDTSLSEASQKIQGINQENDAHYAAFRNFWVFSNKCIEQVIKEYLSTCTPTERVDRINQLSDVSQLLLQMGEYNVSATIMSVVLGTLQANKDIKESLSENTSKVLNDFEEKITSLFKHTFYADCNPTIPRVELVKKTQESVNSYLDNRVASNECIRNLEMLAQEMKENKEKKINTSSKHYELLPADTKSKLSEHNLQELITREKMKDSKNLEVLNQLIKAHRDLVDICLTNPTYFSALKEILVRPLSDYISHFEKKGSGGAGFFSTINSPVTRQKKEVANQLITDIKGAENIYDLLEKLKNVSAPHQLNARSEKKPQLLVIRDELLKVAQEYQRYSQVLDPEIQSVARMSKL